MKLFVFIAGAIVGYILLRANLNPPGGRLINLDVARTVLVATAASLIAGLFAHVVDQLLGLESLTENGGGGGSVAGPAFSKIMSFALRRYGVTPTGAKSSHLPTTW